MKRKIGMICLCVLAVFLVAVTVMLYWHRVTPRRASELLGQEITSASSVSVSCVEGGTLILSEKQRQRLARCLEGTVFYFEGSTGGSRVIEGRLYHLTLQQNKPGAAARQLSISDRGAVYMEKKQYRIQTDAGSESLAAFLQGLFD